MTDTRRLTISYGGNTLYDADVLAIDWSQDEDGVKVTGRTTPRRSSADLVGIKQKIKALQDINAAVKRNGQPIITEGATDG